MQAHEQGSSEWHALRAGKITASNFKAVMSNGRGSKPSEARLSYLANVIAGRLAGPPEEISSAATDHGKSTEDLAIGRYEWERGPVEKSGFVVHPRLNYCGASPDGFIGADAGIEVKSPFNRGIHIKTIIRDAMPDEHIPQVQGCMFVTGRQHWVFVSYCPSLPPPWDYYETRIERDNDYIAKLEVAVIEFEEEVQAAIAEVESRSNKLESAA